MHTRRRRRPRIVVTPDRLPLATFTSHKLYAAATAATTRTESLNSGGDVIRDLTRAYTHTSKQARVLGTAIEIVVGVGALQLGTV